jgi:hypothetical protein
MTDRYRNTVRKMAGSVIDEGVFLALGNAGLSSFRFK